jgi:UDP-N-acetylglucosamine acyltransferase
MAMATVDPTARIAAGAVLGADVSIGPYCVIGENVVLGDGCRLIAHVHIAGHTTIGARASLSPFVSLGTAPQSTGYRGEPTRLEIGDDCDFREGVTVNLGTVAGGGVTRIGERCFMMAQSHVAHDCIVGDNVTFANCATLGGHCEVGDFTFIGGLSALHQFTRVGESVMIGGLAGVRGDVIPFGMVSGAHATLDGVNVVGMKRRKFSREVLHAVRTAARMAFDRAHGTMPERLAVIEEKYGNHEPVQKIVAFLRSGRKRPLCWPPGTAGE